MSRYTHIFSGQESEAVAGLPDLSLPSSEKQKAVATGTDNLPVDGAYKPAYKKKLTLIVIRCLQLALVKSNTRLAVGKIAGMLSLYKWQT